MCAVAIHSIKAVKIRALEVNIMKRKKRIRRIKLTMEYECIPNTVSDEQIEKALVHFADMLRGSKCSLYNIDMRCLDFKFMKR